MGITIPFYSRPFYSRFRKSWQARHRRRLSPSPPTGGPKYSRVDGGFVIRYTPLAAFFGLVPLEHIPYVSSNLSVRHFVRRFNVGDFRL